MTNKKPIAAGSSSIDLVDEKKLFDELQIHDGDTFLDVACGNGAYSIIASRYAGGSGHVYAVDLWKEGIESLERQIQIQDIKNIHASVADVSDHIPVADRSVDICLLATVLHDLIQDKTDAGTLKEIKRVLKPEGTLAIVEFKKIDSPPGPPIRIKLSPEELEKHLQPYSFDMTRMIDVGTFTYLALFQ
ncbi:MAG: class I SAM-dependent methyltransferase [Deltaproteobacteria bacterium]|nr:class I SAM-dependent methyltransferase [Deltaproteobacteria bacterium]